MEFRVVIRFLILRKTDIKEKILHVHAPSNAIIYNWTEEYVVDNMYLTQGEWKHEYTRLGNRSFHIR